MPCVYLAPFERGQNHALRNEGCRNAHITQQLRRPYGEEHGRGRKRLVETQCIIDAETSDLNNLLAHGACGLPMLGRELRAQHAR